jgi:hypothetical protein
VTTATASPSVPRTAIDGVLTKRMPTPGRGRQIQDDPRRRRSLRGRFIGAMRELVEDVVDEMISPF